MLIEDNIKREKYMIKTNMDGEKILDADTEVESISEISLISDLPMRKWQ